MAENEIPGECDCGGSVELIRPREKSLTGERVWTCSKCGRVFGEVSD